MASWGANLGSSRRPFPELSQGLAQFGGQLGKLEGSTWEVEGSTSRVKPGARPVSGGGGQLGELGGQLGKFRGSTSRLKPGARPAGGTTWEVGRSTSGVEARPGRVVGPTSQLGWPTCEVGGPKWKLRSQLPELSPGLAHFGGQHGKLGSQLGNFGGGQLGKFRGSISRLKPRARPVRGPTWEVQGVNFPS